MLVLVRVYLGLSPLPVTVANEGLVRDPRLKIQSWWFSWNPGQGDNPRYIVTDQPTRLLINQPGWNPASFRHKQPKQPVANSPNLDRIFSMKS